VVVNQKAYLKLDTIGRGGSSKVYKVLGEDKNIYALKQVDLHGVADFDKKQYIDEIKLLERLRDYPCIINLIESELASSYLYIILECGEIDLAGILARHKVRTIFVEFILLQFGEGYNIRALYVFFKSLNLLLDIINTN